MVERRPGRLAKPARFGERRDSIRDPANALSLADGFSFLRGKRKRGTREVAGRGTVGVGKTLGGHGSFALQGATCQVSRVAGLFGLPDAHPPKSFRLFARKTTSSTA